MNTNEYAGNNDVHSGEIRIETSVSDGTEKEGFNNDSSQYTPKKDFTQDEIEAAKNEFENLSDLEKEEYIEQSGTEGLLSINALKIKRLYPNAYKEAAKYISEKSRISQSDDMLIGIFLYGPRTILYEFFDDYGFYINILGSKEKWHYTITSDTIQVVNGGQATSRIEAEKLALNEAFSHVNKF